MLQTRIKPRLIQRGIVALALLAALRGEVGELRERMAKLEGLLWKDLREAVTGRPTHT